MEAVVKLPNRSPEINANPLSKLFFCWILPLLKYGASSTVQNRDVYDTLDADSASTVSRNLEQNWNDELKKSRIKNRNPNLKKTILYTFGQPFLLYGLYLFIQSIFIRTLQPIVLAELIWHYEFENPEHMMLYYFAAIAIALSLINNLIYHHCYVGCARIGTRAKVACSVLIEKKTLKLSQRSINRLAPGRLVKLLSDDVKKIESAAPYLHYLYITPLQFLASTYVSYHVIGAASLAGLLFILVVSVPQGYLSRVRNAIHGQLSVFADGRLKVMREILYGMRVIKTYGWEKPFEKKLETTRILEIVAMSKSAFIKCCSISTLVFTQTIAIFFTLTAHVMLGNSLEADQVFAVVLIFYNLQQYACYFLPEAIERYLEASLAMVKIENFLTMEEKEEQIKIISYSKGARKPGTVRVSDASARWGAQPVLNNINLSVPSGGCCCIFGPSGAGKSSLVKMLLKELPAASGRVDVAGTISYASQTPWLFSSSIKTNILCGQPYNKHKYKEILKICSLEEDLKRLPCGDRTSIEGLPGASSGIGEKINLARTFYRDADIYVIDDAFGKLDAGVANDAFSEGVLRYLAGRTRIFVSNRLYHAKEAGSIVVLETGNVSRIIETEYFNEADFQYLNKKLAAGKDFAVPRPREDTDIYDGEKENRAAENAARCKGYFRTIREYLNLNGRKFRVGLVVMLVFLAQVFTSLSDFWLTQWINIEISNRAAGAPGTNQTQNSSFSLMYHTLFNDLVYGLKNRSLGTDRADRNESILGIPEADFFVYCYAGFIVCCIVFTALKALVYHAICLRASRALHNTMFHNVLFSPVKFFDHFSPGVILRRFSKDLDAAHRMASKNLLMWQMCSAALGSVLLMVFMAPALIPPLMLILIMVYFSVCSFGSTARALQKLETKAQWPIYSFVSCSFRGIFTIRSAEAEELVLELFEHLLDKETGIAVASLYVNEYFGFYVDLLATLFMGITAIFVVIAKFGEYYDSAYFGLIVAQGTILTELVHLGLRESVEAMRDGGAVDEAMRYTRLAAEDVDKCTLVPKNWPFCGKIVFKNVYIKDNDSSGCSLKNLNIVIRPAEKIAVVSSYPGEKWTVVSCLLRLTQVEGLVMLDEVDTNSISLHKLRSNITFIPKDPVLFSASVRQNLDPLDYSNDEMLWKVLEEVGLKTSIQSLSQPIVEEGLNLSSEQKQLICLARALLRHSKVLIVENNPSDLDSSTNKRMRRIIKEKFRNCTVITVANSLDTIMENDKILVIDDGKEVEYAHAHELLQNPDGCLSRLVKDRGPDAEELLRKTAKDHFESKNLQISFRFK
ncbi:unnamed protein product [Phyllotreta striolata]|uniref:Uncharacterized protein n=1 Tax=Phyllotreta striolata TaxID=444603 RepID=A0A9N9TUD9_PHYSR|nr:unnamed protein product [Phyllotreta striolata]